MDENRYNTRVRHAISNEYVECMKNMQNLERRLLWIQKHIEEEQDTITMKDYNHFKFEMDEIEKKVKVWKIAMDVWDQAREICLNIADEMCKEE